MSSLERGDAAQTNIKKICQGQIHQQASQWSRIQDASIVDDSKVRGHRNPCP